MADVTVINQLPFPELEDTADIPRDFKNLAEKLDPGIVPVGAMMMWPAAAAPNEAWLLCIGQGSGGVPPVLAVDYPDLAAVLGVSGPNIKMPNLVGRIALGAGSIPNSDPARTAVLGSMDGRGNVKLEGNESGIAKHSHAASGPGRALANSSVGNHSHGGATQGMDRANPHAHTEFGQAHLFNVGNGAITAAASASPSEKVATGGADINHLHAINADGAHNHAISGSVEERPDTRAIKSHENMPPYYTVNYIIRAK
jgi:microcystin-dependent protein